MGSDDERLPASVDVSRPRADSRYRWANVLYASALFGAAGSLFLHDYMHLPRAGMLGLAGALWGLAAVVTHGVSAFATDAPRLSFVGRVRGKLALMTAPDDLDSAVWFEDVVASAYRVGHEVVVVARDGSVSTISLPTEARAIAMERELFPARGPVRVPLARTNRHGSAISIAASVAFLVPASMVMAAVFGVGLADTLSWVRSEKLGGLGVVSLAVIAMALGVLGQAKKLRARMAIVGDDAVVVDVAGRPLPFADLVGVGWRTPTRASSAAGVVFRMKNGDVDLPVEAHGPEQKWTAHLLSVVEAKRAARASSDPVLPGRIGRAGRSVAEWRIALDRSANTEAGYREVAIEEAALLEMLEDGQAAEDAKVAAAYLLSKVASDRAVALTERATNGMVVKKQRARIVAAARGRLKA